MNKNIGMIDRVARAAFAVIVGVLYFMGMISGTVALVLGAVAVILFATSVVSFCPIYWALGLRTAPKSE